MIQWYRRDNLFRQRGRVDFFLPGRSLPAGQAGGLREKACIFKSIASIVMAISQKLDETLSSILLGDEMFLLISLDVRTFTVHRVDSSFVPSSHKSHSLNRVARKKLIF